MKKEKAPVRRNTIKSNNKGSRILSAPRNEFYQFGKGFAEQSLRNMRQFFLCFEIRSALRSELRWTHYKMLIRVENEAARAWYLTEAADRNWSTRALERERALVVREQQERYGEEEIWQH